MSRPTPPSKHHGSTNVQYRSNAGRARPQGLRPEVRQSPRAIDFQQSPAGDLCLPPGHHRAWVYGDQGQPQCQLRENAANGTSLHTELPGEQGPAARPRQHAPGGRREHARRHFRRRVPRDAAQGQRRAVPDPGRRPGLGEVDLDAGGSLYRSHRGRICRRSGDAGRLRRVQAVPRAAAAEHHEGRPGRQPGRERLQVCNDRGATARRGSGDRRAHRLLGAVARDREERARQVRDRRRHVQGPRDRVRQDRRVAARRHPAGDGVFRSPQS